MEKGMGSFFKRELRGKLRIYIAWLTGVLLIILTHQTPALAGLLVILMGALLRAYSSGCIEKESRLSEGGPFRFCRNPLYVGSLLITLGAFVSQGYGWVGLVVVAVSMAVYQPLVAAEEKVLAEKFGAEYQDYLRRVPRYIPGPQTVWNAFKRVQTSKPSGQVRASGFDFDTFKKNHGWEPILVGAGVSLTILAIFWVKQAVLGSSTLASFH